MATETQTASPITAAQIRAIPPGKAYAGRGDDLYYLCASRGGMYVVECGWLVQEAYDDDPGCSTYWPFAGRLRHDAWVGREVSTRDADEAARLYEQYRAAVLARRGADLPGSRIGNVVRSSEAVTS